MVGQKSGPQTHDHNSVKSSPIKKNTGRFFGKLVVKSVLKIPPHPEGVMGLLITKLGKV